jgi:hypothetical protein
MKQFNLEKQYQLYLERVGIQESQMHPTQKVEMKRAFMGACGQMLILLRDDLGALEEDEAIQQLQDMMNQLQSFWLKETNQTN